MRVADLHGRRVAVVDHPRRATALIATAELLYPRALRQRCLIHRLRNIAATIPTGMQPETRDEYRKLFGPRGLDIAPGPTLVEAVDKRITAVAGKYPDVHPAAMTIREIDREGLTAYLRFPREHHVRSRHSHFIKRTFDGATRRTEVTGRVPARPAPCPSYGRCSTGPRPAGAA